MGNATTWSVAFEQMKPQVRLVGKGVIMPNSNGLIFPFEAINLNAVEVEVFQIYHNNILQFLQTNELDGGTGTGTGGPDRAAQKKIDLKALNPSGNSAEWSRYALDLSKLLKQDLNSIYQVRIAFRKEYTNYVCDATPAVQLFRGR